jgi:flagellar biosynthesis/type III secretory pathway M-ring protein FliF/YscJ
VEFLIVLAVLAVVVFIVTGPLRREYTARARAADEDPGSEDPGSAEANEVAELEAAREAKYREIRDAELDHRTGKLSDADFEAVDSTLRGEAVEILHRLDRVPGTEGPAPRDPDGAHPNDDELEQPPAP